LIVLVFVLFFYEVAFCPSACPYLSKLFRLRKSFVGFFYERKFLLIGFIFLNFLENIFYDKNFFWKLFFGNLRIAKTKVFAIRYF